MTGYQPPLRILYRERQIQVAEQPEYWFPAKRYGWGWGPPRTWQGWVVLAVFFALFGAGFVIFSPAEHGVGFFIYNAVLVVLLIAVCYAKGEPPRWRWARSDGDQLLHQNGSNLRTRHAAVHRAWPFCSCHTSNTFICSYSGVRLNFP